MAFVLGLNQLMTNESILKLINLKYIYLMMASIQLISLPFILFVIVETKGLQQKEKKYVYNPTMKQKLTKSC